jgi:hypothetical protein
MSPFEQIFPQEWRGVRLISIPTGLGRLLPAAVAADHGEELQVICLHPEYHRDWVLTVKRKSILPNRYRLTGDMKSIISQRQSRRIYE